MPLPLRLHECPKSGPEQEQYQWSYHYNKILSQLSGSQQQKQSIIRKRILRYFGQFKLDSEFYHTNRYNVDFRNPQISILSDRLILYGIDFMSIEKAKLYLKGYATNVRRIDDSHFLVQFRNQAQCLSAINRRNLGRLNFVTVKDVLKLSNSGWIEMQPYHQFIFERKIMARFATNFDKIDNFTANTKNSLSLAYSEAKRRFFKNLKHDLQSEEDRRLNNQDNSSRSSSRERSRDKYQTKKNDHKNYNQQRNRFGRDRFHNRDQNRQHRNRNFQKSRSRSRSPSLDMYDTNGNLIVPKLIQEQRIKQSNFKFQLYIKRRDKQIQRSKFGKTNTNNNFKRIDKSANDLPVEMLESIKISNFVEKSHSTNQCEIDAEFLGKAGDAMDIEPMRHEEMNTSEADFTTFLRNLKLTDSKNQYSAFDLEMD